MLRRAGVTDAGLGQTGQVASGRRRGLLLASVFHALETVRESWVAAKGVEA
jgi:hypothetical protein